jgi:hypothetical protein
VIEIPINVDYRQALEAVRTFIGQSMSLFDAVLTSFAVRESLMVRTYDHRFDILGAARWYQHV